jgi:hypothetical protein
VRTAYLSSTFEDLKAFRAAVAQSLRRSNVRVVGMDDYVADDRRPVEKCLADLDRSDVYVGLFAFRYGYVPEVDNPDCRSITELEYRHAAEQEKCCLIFLLADDADWKRHFMDEVTGDGAAGARIKALRAELKTNHVVSCFHTPDEVAGLVTAAILAQDAVGPPSCDEYRETWRQFELVTRRLEKERAELRVRQVLKGILGICASALVAGCATLGASPEAPLRPEVFLLFGVFGLPAGYLTLRKYELCSDAVTTLSMAVTARNLEVARAVSENLRCFPNVSEVVRGIR